MCNACILQWATTEGGIQDSTIAGQGGASLFPLLKAAADLLMMPKELLMEPTIRRDTSQALSVRYGTVCCVNKPRFAPLALVY